MTFDQAILIVLKHEGGYNNIPADPGGETNFGISKRVYPHVDIKNLTTDQAIEIYRKDYWNKNNIDSFPSFIRLQLFDMAVNAGSSAAFKILQRALNTMGAELKVDGKVGDQTMWALNQRTPMFAYVYALQRIAFYHSLKNKTFLSGWISRALNVASIHI